MRLINEIKEKTYYGSNTRYYSRLALFFGVINLILNAIIILFILYNKSL